jgi:hypothetical protein
MKKTAKILSPIFKMNLQACSQGYKHEFMRFSLPVYHTCRQVKRMNDVRINGNDD